MLILILLILIAAIGFGNILVNIASTTTLCEIVTTQIIIVALIILAGYWFDSTIPHP